MVVTLADAGIQPSEVIGEDASMDWDEAVNLAAMVDTRRGEQEKRIADMHAKFTEVAVQQTAEVMKAVEISGKNIVSSLRGPK